MLVCYYCSKEFPSYRGLNGHLQFCRLKPGYYDRPHKSRRGLSEDGHSSQIEGLFDDGHSSQVETSSVLMDINIESHECDSESGCKEDEENEESNIA
jgi:hypothetical protein